MKVSTRTLCAGAFPLVVCVVVASAAPFSPGQRRRPPASPAHAAETQERAAFTPHDSLQFADAARLAWKHFNKLWSPGTGLAFATADYNKLTSWDIGSVLAATYSARVLGIIDSAEYDRRVSLTLRTVNALPLYRGFAYHRVYLAKDAKMAGRGGGLSTRGYGYSATDVGRLMLWLRIIADVDPQHGQSATRAAHRLGMDSIVSGGYLHGEDMGESGKRRHFQEGRIGYEQYAAAGFSAWGADVAAALDVQRNAKPVTVSGAQILEDTRGLDRVTSDPFVLLGLEVGWSAAIKPLALEVLHAQENRATETGVLTFASEDAVGIPPYYFYYYCVYCTRKPFVIEISQPGRTLTKPRWVSTKAIFAWHALVNSAYTRRGMDGVQAAANDGRGWNSGLFEGTQKPTNTFDINTAAVILEAAAYARIGRPLSKWKSAE